MKIVSKLWLGLEHRLGLRALRVFGMFFHNPVSELQKGVDEKVILELGVWPISKKLIGPLP